MEGWSESSDGACIRANRLVAGAIKVRYRLKMGAETGAKTLRGGTPNQMRTVL